MVNFNYHKQTASSDEIKQFEEIIGMQLPNDYRQYLLSGGGGVSPKGYYAFKTTEPGVLVLGKYHEEVLLGYLSSAVIEENGFSELMTHFRFMNSPEREYAFLPDDIITIGSDQGGGSILLGIGGNQKGKIFYLNPNLFPDEEATIGNYENISFVANSFPEFLDSLYKFDS